MKISRLMVVLCSLGALLAGCDKQAAVPAPAPAVSSTSAAATVYLNGTVITVDDEKPQAEAVAVRDGRIIAVGSRQQVLDAAGDNVEQQDLQGNVLLPGLIDTHGHVTYTALMMAAVNVSSPPVGPAESVADVIALLRQDAEKSPDAPWIIGYGYDDSLLAEQRHPTRRDLDKVSSEKPVLIRHVSGHFMSCNSRCLELAGITAETEDPKGGVIRREAGGSEPDGVLEETAMMPLLSIMPEPDETQRLALLDQAQQYYASHGITTVQDGATSPGDVALLRRAAAEEALYLDVVAYPYMQLPGVSLDDFPPSREYQGHFRVGGIKLVLDGSPQGKTAYMTQPYLHPPHGQEAGYRGYPTLDDEEVARHVDRAFSADIPVLAHANGDAASDQLIDAVRAANARHGPADRRTVMIHAQTVREDQQDAMQAEGIIPSYFVVHTFYWGDWHRDSVFGPERASRISPLRTTAERGMPYTTHNDTPIVPPDMMRLLWSGVNRVTRSGQVLGEAQRVSALEALKSMTLYAAYQYFEERDKGSIEVGKLADFVILDGNPLAVKSMAIKDIAVLETIKDGVSVYRR